MPPARTSKSSTTSAGSSRTRSSTPRSRPWCAGSASSVSYDQLVQRLTGARIDKSSRFTDWSRRPLSERQIEYALADVTHLRDVYQALSARLDEQSRTEWVREEMEVLTSPGTYQLEPEEAWKRLKLRVRKPIELAVLREVAAWREREAQARDVPRGRVIKDDAIYEIAAQQPTTATALGQLRTIPRGFERSRAAEDILAAVRTALAIPRDELPRVPKHRPLDQRQRRRGRPAQGAAQDDQREPRRRVEDHRHRRRPRGDRQRRHAPTCRRCTAGGASCSARLRSG